MSSKTDLGEVSITESVETLSSPKKKLNYGNFYVLIALNKVPLIVVPHKPFRMLWAFTLIYLYRWIAEFLILPSVSENSSVLKYLLTSMLLTFGLLLVANPGFENFTKKNLEKEEEDQTQQSQDTENSIEDA